MKNFFLSMVLISVIGIKLSAQSGLQLFQAADGLPAAQSYTFNIAPGDPTFIYSFGVKNVSSGSKSTKVTKSIIQFNPAYTTVFCYGSTCYGPGTITSSTAVNINANSQIPGSGVAGLQTDFDNGSTNGTCIVRYTVFDINNPADTVSVCITYIVGSSTSGISQTIHESCLAYPNPVSDVFIVRTKGADGEILAEISDAAGCSVKKMCVRQTGGEIPVSVSDLPNGIYFYQITVSNKRVYCGRFMVLK